MRNIRPQFAAESIDVELQSHSSVAQPRQVYRRGLQIEAVRQSQSRERQAIAFPVSCAAQLRKSLAHPWGGSGYDPVPPRWAGGSQNEVRRCV